MNTSQSIGGLNVPDVLGVSKSQGEAIHQSWDTYERIIRELENKGFSSPTKPECPMPALTERDLLIEDNAHITTIYSQANSWHGYTKTTYAFVRAMLVQLENELEVVDAETRKWCKKFNATAKKDDRFTTQDIEDAVITDNTHKKLKLKTQEYEQKKIILDAMVDNLERTMRVISRQIEINRQEIEAETIKNNMPNRGHGPPRGFGR